MTKTFAPLLGAAKTENLLSYPACPGPGNEPRSFESEDKGAQPSKYHHCEDGHASKAHQPIGRLGTGALCTLNLLLQAAKHSLSPPLVGFKQPCPAHLICSARESIGQASRRLLSSLPCDRLPHSHSRTSRDSWAAGPSGNLPPPRPRSRQNPYYTGVAQVISSS